MRQLWVHPAPVYAYAAASARDEIAVVVAEPRVLRIQIFDADGKPTHQAEMPVAAPKDVSIAATADGWAVALTQTVKPHLLLRVGRDASVRGVEELNPGTNMDAAPLQLLRGEPGGPLLLVSRAQVPYHGPPPYRCKIGLWGRFIDPQGRATKTRFPIGKSHLCTERHVDVRGVWTDKGWVLAWGLYGQRNDPGFQVYLGFVTPAGTVDLVAASKVLLNTSMPRLFAQPDGVLLAVRSQTGVRRLTLDMRGRIIGSPLELGGIGELVAVFQAGVVAQGSQQTRMSSTFARVTGSTVTHEPLLGWPITMGYYAMGAASRDDGVVLLWLGDPGLGVWLFEP